MNFLYDWLRQIVVLIFIGTILEMLLPSNRLKKYVHFVFGLLFLLLLGQPIFYLLKTDITEHISTFEHYLMQDESELEETKQQVEKQKEDIQAEQVAYIWNELEEQYKVSANPILESNYNLKIKDITFHVTEGEEVGLESIGIHLQNSSEANINKIKPIENVTIGAVTKNKNEPKTKDEMEIEQTLRNIWQLEEEVQFTFYWGGGTID
ncbi:MAG TPA: stage III sporulation protein AF [Pseudogracilibacillus sp.]|nr:stage III sporulation protein AF [Pseudogracilibacillus sp.]